MDIKKVFQKHESSSSFIKVTGPAKVDGSTKAALNRKGNQLYNEGDIEGARRIFLTTKYSDGISRIGDYYKSKNRIIDALQMYYLAPDQNKSQPLIEQLAGIMQSMLHEDEQEEDNE